MISRDERSGRLHPLVEATEVDPAARDAYPWSLPAVTALTDGLDLDARVTYLVGENGSGKSTLIEALAVAAGLNPEGGSRNFSHSTRDSHSDLWEGLRLVRGSATAEDRLLPQGRELHQPPAVSNRSRATATRSAPTGAGRCTSSRTESRSWPCSSTASARRYLLPRRARGRASGPGTASPASQVGRSWSRPGFSSSSSPPSFTAPPRLPRGNNFSVRQGWPRPDRVRGNQPVRLGPELPRLSRSFVERLQGN